MIRVIVRVKDKYKAEQMERYGSIVYKSPILNIIGLEISEKCIDDLKDDENVLSCEVEPEGRLMSV